MASQDKVVSSEKEDELANNESFVDDLTKKLQRLVLKIIIKEFGGEKGLMPGEA